MRHVLATATAAALLVTSGGTVGAQEEDGSLPHAGGFDGAGSLSLARTGHTATLLPDGRVLITGGDGIEPEDLATAEVWDPATSTFGPAEELAEPRPEPLVEAELERSGHSATLLPDGRALVVGGLVEGAPSAEAELLTPDSGELVPAGTLLAPRSGHTATFLRDGRVLVVGGTGAEGAVASAELWTSATRPAKCLGKRPTLMAQPGMELIGSAGNDVIAGSVGDDRISGGGGSDRICGYGGADTIDGGAGNDTIDAGPGADMVTGGGGKDRLVGGRGDDELDGGKGKDVCIGGKGTDWLPSCNEAKETRGVVTLTRSRKLKGPHTGAFVIGKDGITFDCGGHTVIGLGRDSHLKGIVLTDRKRVVIRNCDVRDHREAISLTQSHRNTIVNNRASGALSSISLEASDRNRIIGNWVSDADWGINVHAGSDENLVRDNTSERMIGPGFWVGGGGMVASKGNTFSNNLAQNGQGQGFQAVYPSVGNSFTDNTAIDNRLWGVVDETTGFRGDAGTDNRYSGNTCTGVGEGGDSWPPGLCD